MGAGPETAPSVLGGSSRVPAVELPAGELSVVELPAVEGVVSELGDDELDVAELWVCAAGAEAEACDAPEDDDSESDPPSEDDEEPLGAASAIAGEYSAAIPTPIAIATAEAPVIPRAATTATSLLMAMLSSARSTVTAGHQ